MTHRCSHIAYAALITLAFVSDRVSAETPHPCWIWTPRVAVDESVRFAKTFRTNSPTTSVELSFAPVSARLTISLDGDVVAAAEPYDAMQFVEVEARLRPGDHEIIVQAQGVTGPSAFFLELDIAFADETRDAVTSSSSWDVLGVGPVQDLGPVDPRLIVPQGRRVGIDVVDNYEQWKQALSANEGTDPSSFLLAPGFEIRRVRSALPVEDSWVSMAFDPQGRVIIAKEQQGLLRMTLSHDGTEVITAELIDDSLEECRGLAFVGNDLYVNANNSKGLYRLGHNGDRFSRPELLYASSGGVGHGRNDLAVGPDGKLYSIHGDAVDLPPDVFDYTSPFRDARRGEKTSDGHLLRLDPQSGTVQLLAAGLRNPFGIDFNGDGECFTYDADAEYDMGAPWYRPTRVNHLVTGGDYGWRGVTGSWPPYYPDHPDNAQPNMDIGKGSPTAVKFGTRSNFPAAYRDALFILDWAYGRIIAVHMIPRGSSYLMTAETFLKGRPLNVTDLDFAPDGSMYFVTGGRKTQSALYRVRYVGDREGEQPATTPCQSAAGQFAADSRQLRHELEASLVQAPSEALIARSWQHLSDPDPWIVRAALNVIERHPISMWQSRALTESDITPAVQGLLALCRSGRPDLDSAILGRLNEILPGIETPTDRLTAYYAYWLCLESMDGIDQALLAQTARLLNAQYPQPSPWRHAYEHNRLLSEILIKLRASNAVSKTIGLLHTAANQTQQLHYLYVLRNARVDWTINQRRDFFSGLAQSRHYLGGAGMSSFLKRIRDEAISSLGQEERTQLGSLIQDTPPDQAYVETKQRPLVRKWTVDELVSAVGNSPSRDSARGANVFAAASCIHCHRFGARGTLIGPDLTSVSRRFSRRDLLASIVEPSRVIAENYRSLQIVTTDGKTYVGQATLGGDFRSPVLRLSTNPMQPFVTVEIPKQQIESQQVSDTSWMPTGLLDTFTTDEILDLIAYLESSP